jgi:site-specific DNA-methyltransferase (adenine-specific)/adenine-specific DNA-methyltransferase
MKNDYQKVEQAKGRPLLQWVGKKPLESVQFYPAQETEVYGDKGAKDFNKLFWGDNLQVLSHLLKEYRGKVDLIYIDPPFDSKADYIKRVQFRGEKVEGVQQGLLEEKQYTDIWEKDEYLQFMFDRLLLMKELLSDTGTIYLHCDWARGAELKLIMGEVFGETNFRAGITWQRSTSGKTATKTFIDNTDIILCFSKGEKFLYNPAFQPLSETTIAMYKYDDGDGRGKYRIYPLQKTNQRTPGTSYDYKDNNGKIWKCPAKGWRMVVDKLKALENDGRLFINEKTIGEKAYWNERENEGKLADNIWTDVSNLQGANPEMLDYPTQKPEVLVERIIKSSSNEGDVVLDCFVGSGTTCAVAQQLGRKWIGCDINIGAIQTTTKRLNQIIEDQQKEKTKGFKGSLGFKVLNVNDYNVFKNEIEAKEIVMEMYGVEPVKRTYFDGVLDKNFVKVMPMNRVLNKMDIRTLIKNVDDKKDSFTVKTKSKAGEPVYEEGVLVICSGMELDVLDFIKKENKTGVKIEVRDILTDKKNLIFKKKPEAKIDVKAKDKKLSVELKDFYSPILMRKLEIENEKVLKKDHKAKVEDFKQIIDSVAIDVDYNGKLFNAEVMDLPDKKETIKAKYSWEYAKKGKYTVAIKVVDVLGEEYFETFEVNA